MRLLADLHITPRTVQHLRSRGHDVARVDEVLPPTASDEAIVACAKQAKRAVLTQDLDFSALIALSGSNSPSLILLRLTSSRVEYVNAVLDRVLPSLEQDVVEGTIVTVEDQRIRQRRLPLG